MQSSHTHQRENSFSLIYKTSKYSYITLHYINYMQAELSWDLRPPFPPYVGLPTHARCSEKVIDSHVHHSLRVWEIPHHVCMYVCMHAY